MADRQVPRGPKDMSCPYNGKSMHTVCHKCPKWIAVKGMDPQDSTKQIDRWDCSDAFLPTLLIDLGRQVRSNAKAIELLTAEVGKSSDEKTAMIQTLLTSVNRSYDAIASLPAPQAQKLIS